jgi:hypothetical protein
MPTLWTKPRPIQEAEQRWFIGAHANVGGGCFNDSLAQPPFNWLRGKATALGLTFTNEFPTEPDAAMSPVSDSFAQFLKGWYALFRLGMRYHRPIGVPPKEKGAGVIETIDSTVFSRWRADQSYRPRSVRNWAKRNRVDPANITSSVRADDPSVSVGD